MPPIFWDKKLLLSWELCNCRRRMFLNLIAHFVMLCLQASHGTALLERISAPMWFTRLKATCSAAIAMRSPSFCGSQAERQEIKYAEVWRRYPTNRLVDETYDCLLGVSGRAMASGRRRRGCCRLLAAIRLNGGEVAKERSSFLSRIIDRK